MKIDFSIIIPHRNTLELLSRCLSSIPFRTDLEIIIVDDNTPNIDRNIFPGIDRPDTKIIFLDETKGAGYARNSGISVAKGKWLLFADADDYFTVDFEKLLDKYKDDFQNDIVYLNSQYFFEADGTTSPTSMNRYINRYLSNKFYSEQVLRYGFWSPWSRMVKRQLVVDHKIRFEEIPVGNDRFFALSCSKYAQTFAVYPIIVYNYFMPKNGSVTCNYQKQLSNIQERLALSIRINQLYASVGYKIMDSLFYSYLANLKQFDASVLKPHYKRHFNDNKLSFLVEIYRLFVYIVARTFKIV